MLFKVIYKKDSIVLELTVKYECNAAKLVGGIIVSVPGMGTVWR
jgi:hypothetical protein